MPDDRKYARRYDAEFKENAVAHDLGVSGWTLRRWIAARRNGTALSEP